MRHRLRFRHLHRCRGGLAGMVAAGAGCSNQGEGERCTFFPNGSESINGSTPERTARKTAKMASCASRERISPRPQAPMTRCCPPDQANATVQACMTGSVVGGDQNAGARTRQLRGFRGGRERPTPKRRRRQEGRRQERRRRKQGRREQGRREREPSRPTQRTATLGTMARPSPRQTRLRTLLRTPRLTRLRTSAVVSRVDSSSSARSRLSSSPRSFLYR